ncbi:MAG: ribonuclease HI family protein [Bacillota bacterium]|nr:ribonuclease HI family protein [Bacillota bacterium]
MEPSGQHGRAASAVCEHAVCHIDGAARGNPGPASFGVAFFDGAHPEEDPWLELSAAIGHATNNTAEYQALLAALSKALELGIRSLTVRSDSQLLIRQMTGQYRVREPHLQTLYDHAKRLERCFARVRYEHVGREANKRADKLANQALDVQEK